MNRFIISCSVNIRDKGRRCHGFTSEKFVVKYSPRKHAQLFNVKRLIVRWRKPRDACDCISKDDGSETIGRRIYTIATPCAAPSIVNLNNSRMLITMIVASRRTRWKSTLRQVATRDETQTRCSLSGGITRSIRTKRSICSSGGAEFYHSRSRSENGRGVKYAMDYLRSYVPSLFCVRRRST